MPCIHIFSFNMLNMSFVNWSGWSRTEIGHSSVFKELFLIICSNKQIDSNVSSISRKYETNIRSAYGLYSLRFTYNNFHSWSSKNVHLYAIYFVNKKHVFCFIFEYALVEFDVIWKLFPFNYLIFEIIVKVKGVMHSSFFIISAIIIHRWISKLKRFWWGRFLCKDDWLLLLAGQERSWCLLHTKK